HVKLVPILISYLLIHLLQQLQLVSLLLLLVMANPVLLQMPLTLLPHLLAVEIVSFPFPSYAYVIFYVESMDDQIHITFPYSTSYSIYFIHLINCIEKKNMIQVTYEYRYPLLIIPYSTFIYLYLCTHDNNALFVVSPSNLPTSFPSFIYKMVGTVGTESV